ncbi:MAG: hypothetical protein AAGA30_20390 [Planctomycetota bacterium]
MNFILILAFCLPLDTAGKGIDLTGIKCVVSGKSAARKHESNYKGGKIFFDSRSSQQKYKFDALKYVARANHQLVVTGQYVQLKCPATNKHIAGRKTYEKSIFGVKVHFCCQHCANKFTANKASQNERLFGKTNFDKYFVVNPQRIARR